MSRHDVIIIGGGQAALSVGDFLRRTRRSVVTLDAEEGPGGARRHAWASLRLFSPARWSSLTGRPMPVTAQGLPTRDEVIDCLGRYEARYSLHVGRPVHVDAVERTRDGLVVRSGDDAWQPPPW